VVPALQIRHQRVLKNLGPNAPVNGLMNLSHFGERIPLLDRGLEVFKGVGHPPDTGEGCMRALENRERMREPVRRQLQEHELVAMKLPTWSNSPRLIGDLNTPREDNSQNLAPESSFPAITVAIGYVRDLPVGLQIFGDAWSEPRLIALAHAYEQVTKHRRPPTTTPRLNGGLHDRR
jgi:amidase